MNEIENMRLNEVIFGFFKRVVLLSLVVCGCYLSFGGGGVVQAQTRPVYVYDREFARLAEILGALHYLYPLCGEEGQDWRGFMEKLLGAEKPDEARRTQFVAAFNRSYQSFAENYRQCTPPARAAIDMYSQEGAELAHALINRYGN